MAKTPPESHAAGAPILNEGTPVRLSIGVQSRISLTSPDGQVCFVLFINSSRLENNNPGYGLIGGGVEFAGSEMKERLQKEYSIPDENFVQTDPLDVRISRISGNQLPQVIDTILNDQLISPDQDILREISEEMKEIEEISRISNGVIQASNYDGPEVTLQHISNPQLRTMPLTVSGRTNELSQRVLIVYNVKLPKELASFILQNSNILTDTLTTVDKPFLLVPQAQVDELIKLFQDGNEEAVKLPVQFGNSGLDIAILDQIKLLKAT